MIRTRVLILGIASAVVVLSGCKEEQPAGYARIADVPGPAARGADSAAMPASSANSPHGAGNPHAGLFGGAGDAATSGAPSGAQGAGTMGFAPPPAVQVRQGGNILEAAGIAFTLPEGWKQEQPTNSFRLAQYSIPGDAGPAELVVFYFGKGQGGSIEANVRRWVGQFSSDDPTTTTVGGDVGQLERDGLRIALVKTSGTYNPGSMGPMMGGAAAEPKPNWALFGLVVEGGPEGSLFVKVTGPKATMDAQAQNLEAFAQSVRRSNYK